jgi:MFS family permease
MDGTMQKPHAAGTMADDSTLLKPIPPRAERSTTGHDAAREATNALGIEAYQVLVRIGWIFKTETIIMPAVLDALVDSGTLRGLLPVLNRGGQSLPPLAAAGPIGRMPRKRPALVVTTLAMAGCFAVLAVAWGPMARARPDLLAGLFLVVYAAFAAANGLNQLVLATLQGKLIAAGNRGHAMVVSVTVGSVLAILAAVLLLGPWLTEPDGFPKIFAATAAFFALAAVVPLVLDEPADRVPEQPLRPKGLRARLGAGLAAWRRVIAADPALGRLALAAGCFSAVLMLFPHYQAFARDSLGTGRSSLLVWVVVQNVATGLASLVAGPFADRKGTRIVLVWLVGLSALTPLVVTLLSLAPPPVAGEWFWLVYAPLGLNPISLKIFTGYALELAPAPAEHPRYVSIVGAALAAPFVLSPLVGLAVDAIGFRPVFLAGAGVIAAGALVALGLPEPRHREAVVSQSDPGL